MGEWEYLKLDKVLTVLYGKDHSKVGDGDIPVYGSGGIFKYTVSYNAENKCRAAVVAEQDQSGCILAADLLAFVKICDNFCTTWVATDQSK